MEEINFQDRFHELKFQYSEYLKREKSIAKSKIGKYQISKKIDNGYYDTIYLATDTLKKMQVAVKVLDLDEIQREKRYQMKQIRRRLSESQAKLMMICQSDNLVKCYDVYQNQSLRIIFMQYCNGKNLQLQIQQRGRIPQEQAISIMRQIMFGLNQMHRHKIIHRDLKGRNIVSHNGIYKICDFGFAKEMKEGLEYTCLGTVSTMALEVLNRQPYGIKADIWSLGIIFFQMVFGKLPYGSRTAANMIDELQQKSIKFEQKQFTFNNYTASQKITSFLRQILVVDPSKRINGQSLLHHPIFHQKMDPHLTLSAPNLSTPQQTVSLVYLGSQIDQLFSNITEIQTDKSRAIPIKYRMNPQEQQLDYSDNQKWLQSSFLQLSKTQLIFHQIVQKIILNKWLDITSRDVIQMIFLMITRGLNNLNSIRQKAKLKNKGQIQNLSNNAQTLYTQLFARHNQYSHILTIQQDKIISMIYDKILTVFSSESITKKNIFLSGIEIGIEIYDYTKQQQIQYTYKQYAKVLLENLPDNENSQISRVKGYMKYYIQINKITLQEYQQSHLGFKDYVLKKIFK